MSIRKMCADDQTWHSDNGRMDPYAHIDQGAHTGAFGHNSREHPTLAQIQAGNYKKGRAVVAGMKVVIENPRGSLRGWTAPDGTRGESLQKFHYGYFEGVPGADGDELDMYVGPWPESDRVFVVNQYINGAWDEHKVMLGFPDQRTAEAGYISNFQEGWDGLESCVGCSVAQFKWWIANGDTTKPFTAENLPVEEKKMDKVLWDSANSPVGTTLAHVLYAVRAHDGSEGLIFDAVTVAEILADADEVLTFDALVVPFARLEQRMAILRKVMDRAVEGLTTVAMQVTDPFKAKGTTQVACVFELSDGQTLSIFFHNPDVTPAKIMPGDDLVSWKWMLNKKDITIVVAPERGRDLDVRLVARRVMALAAKNSARFASTNAKRAATLENIAKLETEFNEKTVVLNGLIRDIEEAEFELEQRTLAPRATLAEPPAPVVEPEKTEAQAAIDAQDNDTLDKIQARLDAQIDALDLEDLRRLASYDPTFVKKGDTLPDYDLRDELKQGHPDDIQAGLNLLAAYKESLPAPQPELPLEAPAAGGKPDLTYRQLDDLFTAFYPETPAGEQAWNEMAAHTDGTGKVLNGQVDGTIAQLRAAGYTVEPGAAPAQSIDDVLAELDNEPALAAPAAEPAPAAAAPSIDSLPGAVTDDMPFSDVEDAAHWLVMNAPRPLYGDTVNVNGPMLEGRHWALIDLTDSMAASTIEMNRQNGAKAVLYATSDEQLGMALQLAGEYQATYLEMDALELSESIGALSAKLNDMTYGELRALKAKGIPEGAMFNKPRVAPEEKPAPSTKYLESSGFKNVSGNVWVSTVQRAGGDSMHINVNVTADGYFVRKSITSPGITGASADIGQFDNEVDANAVAQAEFRQFIDNAPAATQYAGADVLEANGFKHAADNVWTRSQEGIGSRLALSAFIQTDGQFSLRAAVITPLDSGSLEDIGTYATPGELVDAANEAIEKFLSPAAAEPEASAVEPEADDEPHKSELVFDALVDEFGWTRTDNGSIMKNVGGAETGGELNPDGDRLVFAEFDDTYRYLSLYSGFAMVFDIDTRDGTPRDVALAFNTRVMEWARPAPKASEAPATPDDPLEHARARLDDPTFKRVSRDILGSLGTIKSLDAGELRGYDRALFVSSISNKLKVQAKKDQELTGMLLALIDHVQSGFAKPAITARNAIWKLNPNWSMFSPLFAKAAEPEAPAAPAAEPAAEPVTEPDPPTATTPHDNDAWLLGREAIGALADTDYAAIYARLQDGNQHAEALALRAGRIGTEEQYQEALAIMRERAEAGSLTPELSARSAALSAALSGETPAAEPAPAAEPETPAAPAPTEPLNMEKYILVAANSIAKLRRIDVWRVLDALGDGNADGVTRAALASYIAQQRPDLAAEVASVMAEEWPGEWEAPQASTGAEPAAAVSQPLPEGIVDVPPPAPAAPAAGENPARDADLAFLADVAEGRADVWADETTDRMEAMIEKYPGDATVEAAWRAAVEAFSEAMAKAATAV
jgi:hypothetical protein